MAVQLNTVEMAKSGACEARRCTAMSVLVITAGDKTLCLCEQCFREMVDQSEYVKGFDEAAVHALEEKVEELEGTVIDLQYVNRNLEGRLKLKEKQNETAGKS